MCGIVGKLDLLPRSPVREDDIRQMLAMVRHRGPDQFGIYCDGRVGLGSARLSIIDLSGGQQPIANEDQTLWIVFNGEIFNYVELRPELEAKGHRFTTNTDTEIILHLFEDHGPRCLDYLNGQFAFAIWDTRAQSLFLARDRLGIRPLFYTVVDQTLLFGSEIKAILADPLARAEIEPLALDQIFTFWSTLSPNTVFRGVFDVPPGHYMTVAQGEVSLEQYWALSFPETDEDQGSGQEPFTTQALDERLAQFRELLIDATQIRLRADVPVGAYLSGGLDSSTTTAIIRNYTHNRLDTFSIAFSDRDYDESIYQCQMADFLGTDHQVVYVDHADVGHVFPEVIWHSEVPVLRTSPAPMYLLSKLVRENNFKVVMTGEGADEFLAGYNIFREAKLRRFWARQPESEMRPALLKGLYAYIPGLTKSGAAYMEAFFKQGLSEVDSPYYSHALRWHNSSRSKRFFSQVLRSTIADLYARSPFESAIAAVSYPAPFERWDALNRAQYLEASIFLSQYLLSSQGDRMGMANSVEGRFPFLDHRLVEFCNGLPPSFKMLGLTEKFLLRKLAQEWLPDDIWTRPKRPYRAPIHRAFFGPNAPEYVEELLSPERVEGAGLFDPKAVSSLKGKAERGMSVGETDDMALAGILSSQLVHWQFVDHFEMPPPLSDSDDVKVCGSVRSH
jgi:asparagine synthase (glutamine-hydrolysing)